MGASERNRDGYSASSVVSFYEKLAARGLTSCEMACLGRIPATRRGSVLDIGVGAGRTTGALRGMFKAYIGIDYSEDMLRAARRRFPGVDLRNMDARQLAFDVKFDCVMFSFNGVDAVDIADRKRVMQNVSAVLNPGGYFLYSMHNFRHPRRAIWMENLFVGELFAWRGFAKPWRLYASLMNRWRNFGRQSFAVPGSVAYVNDPGEDFAMIITYVDFAAERELLRDCGLVDKFVSGNRTQREGFGDTDDWLYVLAQKVDRKL